MSLKYKGYPLNRVIYNGEIVSKIIYRDANGIETKIFTDNSPEVQVLIPYDDYVIQRVSLKKPPLLIYKINGIELSSTNWFSYVPSGRPDGDTTHIGISFEAMEGDAIEIIGVKLYDSPSSTTREWYTKFSFSHENVDEKLQFFVDPLPEQGTVQVSNTDGTFVSFNGWGVKTPITTIIRAVCQGNEATNTPCRLLDNGRALLSFPFTPSVGTKVDITYV